MNGIFNFWAISLTFSTLAFCSVCTNDWTGVDTGALTFNYYYLLLLNTEAITLYVLTLEALEVYANDE